MFVMICFTFMLHCYIYLQLVRLFIYNHLLRIFSCVSLHVTKTSEELVKLESWICIQCCSDRPDYREEEVTDNHASLFFNKFFVCQCFSIFRFLWILIFSIYFLYKVFIILFFCTYLPANTTFIRILLKSHMLISTFWVMTLIVTLWFPFLQWLLILVNVFPYLPLFAECFNYRSPGMVFPFLNECLILGICDPFLQSTLFLCYLLLFPETLVFRLYETFGGALGFWICFSFLQNLWNLKLCIFLFSEQMMFGFVIPFCRAPFLVMCSNFANPWFYFGHLPDFIH